MSNTTNSSASAEALVETWKPFFQAEYERDTCNSDRQSFKDYWSWVRTFLLIGGSGQAGWLAQSATATAQIRDALARERLSAHSHELGKRIAAEWAKDSACRKIYSNPFQGRPNLLDWGRKLQRAASRDRGDGAEIEATLASIESDLDTALRRSPK